MLEKQEKLDIVKMIRASSELLTRLERYETDDTTGYLPDDVWHLMESVIESWQPFMQSVYMPYVTETRSKMGII